MLSRSSAGLGSAASFALAAMAGCALSLNAGFVEVLHSARLGAVVVLILALHLLRFPQFRFGREAKLYAGFLAYMLVEMLWTPDTRLALNTLIPAANFLFILILYGSFIAFHDLRAVLTGTIFGFLAGASLYTVVTGFPLSYPDDFSYNAIAGMYLFGLLTTLLLACFVRWRRVLLFVAVLLVAVGVATTSIKTNLGIAVGVVAAGVVNFRYVLRMLRRNALVLLAVTAALAYAVASNEVVVQSIQRGIDRVALGIEILYQREDLPGYSGFEKRSTWQEEGLKGWLQNPLFGHGVEAFRSRFGITSHATPVDLLYNSGLIGLGLFYGVLASVLWRLYEARQHVGQDLRVTILGALVCYLVISLAGTMHYNTFLAAFVALSSGLLDQYRERRALPAIGMVVHS